MTRLFIDGQEVVLPEQFELELITENPYFTRTGEYTYDIDIDLKVPKNRQVYKNIQRSDVTAKINNRKAVIAAGPYELITGIEVVLSIDDDTAKIQIVAGNSQLNYDGNQKIRDIVLDSVNYDKTMAAGSLLGTCRNYNAVYTPVVRHDNYSINTDVNRVEMRGEAQPDFAEGSKLIPQYYLLYIVENLLSKLGLTKSLNELENNDLWQRVFIVNSRENLQAQDVLPDWTVNEFIEQIELFMNCIIEVDKRTANYSIYDINNYFKDADDVYIDEVVDSLEKTYDTDTNYSFTYKYVTYDFPGAEAYNYLKLKDGIRESVGNYSISSSENVSGEELEGLYKQRYLVYSNVYDIDLVVVKVRNPNTGSIFNSLRIVDRFKDVGDKDSDNQTSFSIVPADSGIVSVWDYESGSRYQCSAVKQVTSYDTTDKDITLIDLINGNVETKNVIPERLYVAIYYGLQKVKTYDMYGNVIESKKGYPNSSPDNYFINEYSDYHVGITNKLPDYTLSLQGNNGLSKRIYENKRNIDTSVEYKFRFITNKIYELNRIFVIKNKRYYCKEIRYKITPEGMDKIAEGVFYLAE